MYFHMPLKQTLPCVSCVTPALEICMHCVLTNSNVGDALSVSSQMYRATVAGVVGLLLIVWKRTLSV